MQPGGAYFPGTHREDLAPDPRPPSGESRLCSVSCKSLQRLGDPIPSSSPLEGPGHHQATGQPRRRLVCVWR